MPINIDNNPYFQALNSTSMDSLPSGEQLAPLFEHPKNCLIFKGLNNPQRSELAAKMLAQFKNMQKKSSFDVNEVQYLLVLTANLTLHYFYEDEEEQASYWERMDVYFQKLQDEYSKLLGIKRLAQWQEIVAATYKIIEYPAASIIAYKNAISLFSQVSSEPEVNEIKDCFLNIIELHMEKANKSYQNEEPSDIIYQTYHDAAEVVQKALSTLKKYQVSCEKLYYYQGQIHFLMASHQNQQQEYSWASQLLYSAILSFLTVLIKTSNLNNQKKLLRSLLQCVNLFENINASVKENKNFIAPKILLLLKNEIEKTDESLQQSSAPLKQKESFVQLRQIWREAFTKQHSVFFLKPVSPPLLTGESTSMTTPSSSRVAP